jgi:hypothetical protein
MKYTTARIAIPVPKAVPELWLILVFNVKGRWY